MQYEYSNQDQMMNQRQFDENRDSDSDMELEKTDSIKKWQFSYNSSTCFLHAKQRWEANM